MSRSPFFLMVLLSAAMGVPYVLFSSQSVVPKLDVAALFKAKLAESGVPGFSGAAAASGEEQAASSVPAPTTIYIPQEPQLEGQPVFDFGEVIRFDVSPKWVVARWTRVSVVSADLQLEGMRVPLVTGMRPDDLAGSLTYYFDKRQKVQRITFEGVTGDDRRLVSFATGKFQLKPEATLGGGLFVSRSWGAVKNALRISLPPVVRSEAMHSKLTVLLELNDSNSRLDLSPQFQAVLAEDKQTHRW